MPILLYIEAKRKRLEDRGSKQSLVFEWAGNFD